MPNDYRQNTTAGLPRGIRNNNPGDIKDDGTAWQGKVGSDGTFIIFSDMGWGTRALGTALVNMINEGYNTVTLLVNQWAPGSDSNDVGAYISAVSSALGIDPNAQIPLTTDTITNLMRAIITHEVGDSYTGYVSDDDLQAGMSLMSNSVSSLLQASVVAVQNNPVPAAIIAVGIGFAIYLLFLRKR